MAMTWPDLIDFMNRLDLTLSYFHPPLVEIYYMHVAYILKMYIYAFTALTSAGIKATYNNSPNSKPLFHMCIEQEHALLYYCAFLLSNKFYSHCNLSMFVIGKSSMNARESAHSVLICLLDMAARSISSWFLTEEQIFCNDNQSSPLWIGIPYKFSWSSNKKKVTQ